MKMVKVNFKDAEYEFEEGIRLVEMIPRLGSFEYKPLAARVNNHFRDLNYQINKDAKIEFSDLRDSDGQKVYQRSLSFVFIRAAREIVEDAKVYIEHSLGKGIYCEIKTKEIIDQLMVEKIKNRMLKIIKEKELLTLSVLTKNEAINLFEKIGMNDKKELLEYSTENKVGVYRCGWLLDYFYGYMVPNTSYLNIFDIFLHGRGLVIQLPDRENPSIITAFGDHKKLSAIFDETESWGDILNIANVANLNRIVKNGNSGEIIHISEALHEKKIANIADMINERNARVIMIAGPSSSGKTTFAERLFIQLRVLGLKPLTLSTDNYFVDREKTPKKPDGSYDFESLDSLDIRGFNGDLKKLIDGDSVILPIFDFIKGNRKYSIEGLQINKDQPIIVEGIHGLNNLLLPEISRDKVFKIYISALTQLNIDNHNRVRTSDARLIRRIVRDSRYRGHDAIKTIAMWKNVRDGEEHNIFPFQEEADVMFNSALVYELAVLKKHVEPLLMAIDDTKREYAEARGLLKLLSNFLPIDNECHILKNSILREFIGGSCHI
ncbi:MAG: nucleoside kinase [Peptostreptococcaceae bacterium]|nr:nucleoside kinase [Peptostreptococcaceae bacterium]